MCVTRLTVARDVTQAVGRHRCRVRQQLIAPADHCRHVLLFRRPQHEEPVRLADLDAERHLVVVRDDAHRVVTFLHGLVRNQQ